MKKIILIMMLILIPVLAKADDLKIISQTEMDTRPAAIDFNLAGSIPVIDKIPSLKNGTYFSFVDNKLNYSATVPLLEKGGFSLNAGYAGDADSTDHKAILTLAYDLGNLEKWGVKVPILKYVGFEPYLAFGAGRINIKDINTSETDYGLGINLISLSF